MSESAKIFLFKISFILQLFKKKSNNSAAVDGFTLLEVIITVLIIGILFAISATTWTAFINQQRINQANQKIYSLLRETQSKAQKQNQSYTIDFRNEGNGLQYVIKIKDANDSDSKWQQLFDSQKDSIELAFYSPNSTNLAELKKQTFNYQGVPADPDLDVNKRIIVKPQDGSSPRKCIIVQDLLGTLRNESDSTCIKDDNNTDISSNIKALNPK